MRKVKTTGSSQRLDLGISRERGRRRMFISREERLFEQKFKRKIKCLFQGEGKRRNWSEVYMRGAVADKIGKYTSG